MVIARGGSRLIPDYGGLSAPAEPAPVAAGGTATLTAPAEAEARPRLRVLDLSRRELAVVTPLVALIVLLGVYPQPLLHLIEPAVAATVGDFVDATGFGTGD
jgi:NADH-quinone oxidoreductase subunit M